jgi:hypothetical protein
LGLNLFFIKTHHGQLHNVKLLPYNFGVLQPSYKLMVDWGDKTQHSKSYSSADFRLIHSYQKPVVTMAWLPYETLKAVLKP